MIIRRASAAVSLVLLALVAVAVAEAALLVLLVVFSSILQLQLNVQLGDRFLQLWTNERFSPFRAAIPTMAVQSGGVIASVVFSFLCGASAAAWRFRRWRPA